MTDVVICNPLTLRSASGDALAALTAAELATAALRELVTRTGLGEGDVDDRDPRQRLRQRRSTRHRTDCGPRCSSAPASPDFRSIDAAVSGLQAVLYTARQVATGAAHVVVAGGRVMCMLVAQLQHLCYFSGTNTPIIPSFPISLKH